MRASATVLILSLGSLVAGCQLPPPVVSPGEQSAACQAATETKQDALMIAVRIPDCRTGAIEWSSARSPTLEYGAFTTATDAPDRITEAAFWNRLRDLVGKNGPPIIYIHGYRNSVFDANTRALAIRTATGGGRPIVTIVWPSYARTTKYYWDEANNEWAQGYLNDQVRRIVHDFRGADIIAHSMGNRILLALLPSIPSGDIAHVVMGSPDVDRQMLERLLAQPDGLGPPTTVYASLEDQALATSWRLHGYPRAGDLARRANSHKPQSGLYSQLRNADLVDTTAVREDRVGHADFIETRQGATDLCLLLTGKTGEFPTRTPMATPHYWSLKVAHDPVSPCEEYAAMAVPKNR